MGLSLFNVWTICGNLAECNLESAGDPLALLSPSSCRKGMLRLAEKNCLRPGSGLIWDSVRAMLVGHKMSELIEAGSRAPGADG